MDGPEDLTLEVMRPWERPDSAKTSVFLKYRNSTSSAVQYYKSAAKSVVQSISANVAEFVFSFKIIWGERYHFVISLILYDT